MNNPNLKLYFNKRLNSTHRIEQGYDGEEEDGIYSRKILEESSWVSAKTENVIPIIFYKFNFDNDLGLPIVIYLTRRDRKIYSICINEWGFHFMSWLFEIKYEKLL